MKRSGLNSLVTCKCLDIINSNVNSRITELVADNYVYTDGSPIFKNVCAKVPVDLSDKIDSLCGFLSISKRAFIEKALLDAVNLAENIIDEEQVYDYLTPDDSNKKDIKPTDEYLEVLKTLPNGQEVIDTLTKK
ncbi:hypothetical protein O2268_005470 [Salmonella enterica]|nr:hypothetical protein [Salmonella enterica]